MNAKLLAIFPVFFLALAGCGDSKKIDQVPESAFEKYKVFQFGTPMWQLLSEKQCAFLVSAKDEAEQKILFEVSGDEERMEMLQNKLPELSAEEKKELAALKMSLSSAAVVSKRIGELSDHGFVQECYQSSDKLFGLDENFPISTTGRSLRDICRISFNQYPITCEFKSDLNPEVNDTLVFENDSIGRLTTVRVSLESSVNEYKDAVEVIKKLQSKFNVKAIQFPHSDPPEMGALVQWSLANNQILATWTPQSDSYGGMLVSYQSTNTNQVDSALELFRQAQLLAGDKKSEFNIGLSFKLYLLSAERGYADAQLAVGKIYKTGEGIGKNIAAAKLWLARAADQGNVEAYFQLAKIYDESESVNQNMEALKWYKKAAELGHAFAQNNLGAMYFHGEGTSKNLPEAYKWCQKAAEQGVDAAQHTLGVIHEKGMIENPDYAKAIEWYQRAADQGFSDAQNNLGTMYEFGNGVPRDIGKAIALYQKSAKQGSSVAKANLVRIDSRDK